MKTAKDKPIRWFLVEDDCYWYIVWARSHWRAKIQYGWYISWNYSATDSLLYFKASVLKTKLSREPKEEWDIFEDQEELLEKWVFTEFYD